MHAITSLILAKKKSNHNFFLFSFKMFSKQIIWYLSLISKADNHTCVLLWQRIWIVTASAKILFTWTSIVGSYSDYMQNLKHWTKDLKLPYYYLILRERDGKKERWKKEREYLFTCEWIHCWSRIFRGFVFFLATWVFVPLSVRCIYSCTLHSWTQFNALYTHNTSFDIACTKSPGPCQKHISIKAQTSLTVYLFKIMYRIRIQVNILSNLW